MHDLLTLLQPIFRDIFDIEDLVVTRESSAATIDGWDSLVHINLVSAIEQEFHIRFALGELESLKNVGDMIDLMEKKLSR
ncbi:Acyl carrier protein [Candidatus Magnetaquicoccaceae bacterium FCR-1]|uniref:Acyl carrier protein n=1 Tax=Candidatus Magnetaquiglobus chichijimensis TaxID=3141448 RepID=A0ABQ0CA63_9PROT